jgi:hypothetical protein
LTGTTIAGSGSYGSDYSELYNPSAIYVSPSRTMYILDTTNYRVLRWQFGDPLGYVVVGGNSAGSSLTQISTSYGMFVDSQYNIYISDAGNNRVTLWLSTNTTSGILVFIYLFNRNNKNKNLFVFLFYLRWLEEMELVVRQVN